MRLALVMCFPLIAFLINKFFYSEYLFSILRGDELLTLQVIYVNPNPN
jgi:hypothetical protein